MGVVQKGVAAVEKVGQTVEKVGEALPKFQRATEQLKKSIGEASKAAQDMQAAVAPLARAISPAPYTPDVLEAASLLGLSMPIGKAQLESAFKAAALRAHPDRGGNAESMKRVTSARETLRPWCHE